MFKKFILLSVFLIFVCQIRVFANIKDSLAVKNPQPISKKIKTRSFKGLDKLLRTNEIKYNPKTNEFNKTYLDKNFALDSVTNDLVLTAKSVMDDLEESQNYLEQLSSDDLITFPVGIKKEIGTVTYVLGISEAKISPEYMEVTAFVKIITPQTDTQGQQKQLFFGANNIRLSHNGGIYGEANLVLLGDVPIPLDGNNSLLVLKGGFNMQTGDLANKTYVTIDCSGFKELGITGEVLFSRDLLEPVDVSYNLIPAGNVKGEFQTIVTDWNNILVEINLPPFQLTKNGSTDGSGKAGLVFELNTAVFDFSDYQNAASFTFPPEYEQYLVQGNHELWRGVYINSLSVVLPAQFKKRSSNQRIIFEASNLLIDNMGVTGIFSVDNILPLNEGDASKWQFSVDHIEAEFMTNNLVGAGFDGKIVLPVTEEVSLAEIQNSDQTELNKKALNYHALIDPISDEYLLSVSAQDSISFNVFKAKATLTPNSYVEFRIVENKFRPKAVLHGNLEIKGSNSITNPDKATVDFKGITFDNLQLQTESPYFQVDQMNYTEEVKFANFPVTISDIGITANDTEAALHFAIDINLMENGFAGGTSLSIVGGFDENDDLQRWQYDRIDLNRIEIEADLGSIQINGMVDIMEDDDTYGDGFYGELGATFNDISVDATAWFGKTNFRYWYVDAYADLSQMPAPPSIGPVLVNGFGGGAYYHMTKGPGTSSSAMIPSGQSYIPDGDSGLGFRALLGFALANEKALNGKVGFEMAFNTSGGLNRIQFFGEAHMMKALDFEFGEQFKQKLTAMETQINSFGDNNTAMQNLQETNLVEYSKVAFPQDGLTFDIGVDAHFAMEMDFTNDTFHATLETYINTPGGFFQGVGPNGRSGWGVVHIAPDQWYVHIGTPTYRVGTKIGIGDFNIENESYFMMGHNLEASPPPPSNVADILGISSASLDSMRDLNQISEGRGFAFGTDFSVDTGNMRFLVFYARFQAGLGFDIMVKDYGETECHGTGQIGIDGWYANGQAYAYLQGELGIRVKFLGKTKKIEILSAGAAVLMQAKLPNPIWFRGYLAGRYSVLGGLVKGRFRFKIEIGDECDIIGDSVLDGLKVISDVKPTDGDTNIDVFTVPQVVFNMQINSPFNLEDDQGTKTYRILLDEYSVTNAGTPIEGEIEWNDNNDVANFVSSDILPPNAQIQIKVEVSFQEQQNGSWITMMEDGQPTKEIEEITFTTGEAPDYIPLHNIVYSYPVVDQNYFYKDESSSGYIKLERGQPYLFSPETDWTQSFQFESDLGIELGSNLSYDSGNKMVNFDIINLSNQKEYTLRFKSIAPEQNNSNTDQDNYTSQNTGQEGNTIEILNNQAQTVTQEDAEVELLTYTFKTSTYNTFAEKIEDKQVLYNYLDAIYANTHSIETDVQPTEPFEIIEITGNDFTDEKPLVETEAVLDDTYYTNNIYQLIYQNYPLEPDFTVDRDITELGLPPKKLDDIIPWYITYLEDEINNPIMLTRIPYRYSQVYNYRLDFDDIQYKIIDAYLSNTSQYQSQIQQYDYIIHGVVPPLQSGNYNVRMQYILPGEILGTSAIFTYTNPF